MKTKDTPISILKVEWTWQREEKWKWEHSAKENTGASLGTGDASDGGRVPLMRDQRALDSETWRRLHRLPTEDLWLVGLGFSRGLLSSSPVTQLSMREWEWASTSVTQGQPGAYGSLLPWTRFLIIHSFPKLALSQYTHGFQHTKGSAFLPNSPSSLPSHCTPCLCLEHGT